ncbi:DUF6879 family protein [Streptomyces sp. NPDC055051]
MRGGYAVADEGVDYRRWREAGERDTDTASPCWAPWVGVVRVTARRDVAMRVRVVSEPVSDCIRYEHAGTAVNTAAGENVRGYRAARRWGSCCLSSTATGRWATPPAELRTEAGLVRPMPRRSRHCGAVPSRTTTPCPSPLVPGAHRPPGRRVPAARAPPGREADARAAGHRRGRVPGCRSGPGSRGEPGLPGRGGFRSWTCRSRSGTGRRWRGRARTPR